VVVLWFVTSGVAATTAQTAPPAAKLPPASGSTTVSRLSPNEPGLYIVGANDALTITVYDQPQLTGRYMVQPDGTLTFPLLGRVKVGGLAVQAIENEVRDRLARGYLKNPQVAVSVESYRSQQIFVLGEVRAPGGFQFMGSMTLIEALARAGSITEQAGLEALIIRQGDGTTVPDAATLQRAQASKDSNVIRVNLDTLQTGGTAQNITLQAGDTIFVPRAELVYLSGLVNSPGAHPYRKGMTVRQALALAGGVNERGSTRRIQIIRTVDGLERTINTNLQDFVLPGDTIVVRERLF
jgi:polysaccharide export outer membrane protein